LPDRLARCRKIHNKRVSRTAPASRAARTTARPRPARRRQLDVVRITKCDHRGTDWVCLDSTVRNSGIVKESGQPGRFTDRNADGHVVEPYPLLGEPVTDRRAGQRRPQHEPRGRPVQPQPQLLVGKILIDGQAEDALVERAGST